MYIHCFLDVSEQLDLSLKLIHKASTLTRMCPTLDLSCEENAARWYREYSKIPPQPQPPAHTLPTDFDNPGGGGGGKSS
jgi:hypothetical protein